MDPLLLVGLLWSFSGPIAIAQQEVYEAVVETVVEAKIDNRPQQIKTYFEERKMPLSIYSEEFVRVADMYGIDWRLLPAIAVRESSGGKEMCENNPFGWGSCSINFSSIEESIDRVGWNLGGHNPNTSAYYSGDTYDKLWSYNGTVMASYPDEVIAIMDKIGAIDK